MIRWILIAIVAISGLTGCANGPQRRSIEQRVTVPDPLPEKLADEGLLVATIAANSLARTKIERLSFSIANVQIDNTLYSKAVRDNYLVIPLKPGEYTLDSLHIFRSLDDRAQTRFPLNFKFRIVSGQATNLGIITLVRDSKAPASENRYWKFLVNNTEEMTAYLQKKYPALAASLTPGTPVIASDLKYTDAAMLEVIRRDIAREAWLMVEDPNTTNYVGGDVGTVAKLLRDTRGKVAAIDVLDSKLKVAMRSCSGHDDRFVCSSEEPALYFVNNTRLEKRDLPAPAKHVWVHTFPPNGLVLVDQNMTISMSSDNGVSWKKHVWHTPKQPLLGASNIKFANGKKGYYVYSTWTVDPLVPEVLYSEYANKGFQRVDIPKMKYWERLIETSQGLLVGPQNSENNTDTAKLYFRPHAQTDWQARPLPGKRCFFLQHENKIDEKLLIQCDGKIYTSTSAGTDWNERVTEKK